MRSSVAGRVSAGQQADRSIRALQAETLEEIPVAFCRRRGAVIDLVLDRARLSRSQFVFTETRGRPAIFWQTQKAAKAANPGARIPRARAIPEGFQIAVDTRERYPYRFAGRGVAGRKRSPFGRNTTR